VDRGRRPALRRILRSGESLAPGGEQFEAIRERKFPLIGDGGGVWSFIHVGDAADATVAAVEHGRRGIYNVVDDDPAPVAEWLPALAQMLGARSRCGFPASSGACSPERSAS
jgi:nucleoside-diphosphate-sugar epimerase